MADRLHPYPMFPQNLTSNPLQQPQIPQQPPQSQQPDPQMISALSNPEHTRMWQQHMNQLQNPYRSQQSGDLAASQMNHQESLSLRMQEFARGQALSHGQGQPIVQQIQQSFGVNAQRMNPSGPAFHDPQAGQSQSLIPSSFSNMPMNTQQQVKATFNMNPMVHAAMSNPNVSRQLKMFNQSDIVRLQQANIGVQHASTQPTAVDMFASSSMQPSQDQMHVSPHPALQPVGGPGGNQGMIPGNPQPNPQKRMMTPAEFQERRNYLLSLISQSENNMASLVQAARNAASVDPNIQQRITQLRNELATRKEVYTRFVATFGAMVTQQMANGMAPSNMSHVNPVTHATTQQPPQPTVSNPQVQPSPVTQAGQSITTQYNISAGNGPPPMPPQGQSALNQQIPIQPTPIGRPNTIPPRTGGTPHQMSGGQPPNNMSPNLGNFTAQAGPKVSNQTRQPMPLDKQRFETTYAQFCRSQNQNINPNFLVQIGERMVDLHSLHVHVMHEGGAQSVTQRDLWAVIGGRLGIIQFPGNDSEPARCGPGIAQQLHNTYEQYLQHFEHAYVLTVRNRPPTGSPQQPMQPINPNPLPIGNNSVPGMSSNPTEVPANTPRNPNPQFIVAAAQYAHMSAQDMRAQGVNEPMITFVERHRSELMRWYQQQVQLMNQRATEQEQKNMTSARQFPTLREQALGLPPGVPRPPQTIPANTVVGMPSGEGKPANGSFVPDSVAAALQKPQLPTQDQIQQAAGTIARLKQVFTQRSLHTMTTQQIPDDQRPEYNQLLERVHKMTVDLDSKLHMYFVVFNNEELLRRYVAIVLTVAKQHQLVITTSPPQHIINLAALRTMQTQIHKLNEEFENRWRILRSSIPGPQQPGSVAPSRPNPATPLSAPPMHNPPAPNMGRPASVNPPLQQRSPPHTRPHPPPPHLHPQPNQPQAVSQQQPITQPIKKPPFHPSIPPSPSAPPPPPSLTSPTPPPLAASSSTPATSAPTPQTTAGSPQTPKSPPSKAAAKTKPTGRTSGSRKQPTASKGPAIPETTSFVGTKRPPEEDVVSFTNVAPSEAEASNAPSPKKAKTEWEGEASEALLKRQQEIDNIKTDEDAATFFDRMKELFAMTASTDNEIHHDIASTLDQILAGVAQEPADAAATAAALSVHGTGDAGPPPTALSPHLGPANDAFFEFIDFSSLTTLEDEDDSKAPTPDLVPSSETNPSPESGSEGDLLGSTGSPDKTKIEESGDRSDPLRLGSLREIDGGESAYYQPDNWKWEGPMHTLDQPWAIFTS